MDGSVGVVEWPILILEGREGWEWVRFSGMMGGKEGHPKKMEGTQVLLPWITFSCSPPFSCTGLSKIISARLLEAPAWPRWAKQQIFLALACTGWFTIRPTSFTPPYLTSSKIWWIRISFFPLSSLSCCHLAMKQRYMVRRLNVWCHKVIFIRSIFQKVPFQKVWCQNSLTVWHIFTPSAATKW